MIFFYLVLLLVLVLYFRFAPDVHSPIHDSSINITSQTQSVPNSPGIRRCISNSDTHSKFELDPLMLTKSSSEPLAVAFSNSNRDMFDLNSNLDDMYMQDKPVVRSRSKSTVSCMMRVNVDDVAVKGECGRRRR